MSTRPGRALRAALADALREQRGALALAALALAGVVVADVLAPWPLKIIFDHILLAQPLPPALGALAPLLARTLGAHGIAVEGLPLLEPEHIPFGTVPAADRAFFTSRNAVRGYVQGGGDLHAAPCDAVGAGTAEELRKHGVEAVFIGDGPDTPTIAHEYAERFGHLRVLFPCAAIGLRTVQRALPDGHALDLPVYAMRAVTASVPAQHDVAIVTSPEHAAALHALLPLDRWAHVVAMGTSTAARVYELAAVNAVVPWASTEMALADVVFQLATPH